MKINKEVLDYIAKNIHELRGQFSETDLIYLYIYLEEVYNDLKDEDKIMFAKILEQIDQDFYTDQGEEDNE